LKTQLTTVWKTRAGPLNLEVLGLVTHPTTRLRYYYILYNDQQMHNYFTNYHTATCFDTIVSSWRIL